MGIEEAVSDDVQINPNDRLKPVYVQVHPTSDSDSTRTPTKPGNRAMTSARN